MKNKLIILMILIYLFLATGAIAKENPYTMLGKWYFGSTFSWYDPDGYNWNDSLAGTTKHPFDGLMDNAFYGKGYFGYTWDHRWRVQLSGGKWASEGSRSALFDANIQNSMTYLVQDSNGNGQPYDGILSDSVLIDASVKPIEIDLSYIFPFKYRKFKPFAGVGYGRYKTESNLTWRNTNSLSLLSLRCIQSVSCVNVHAGIEYFLNKDFAVKLEGKYIMSDKDITIQPEDVSYNVNALGNILTTVDTSNIVARYNALGDEVDIEGFQFGIGFSFYFR